MSSEMIEAFEEVTAKIVEAVHSVLERTAPELVGDIATNLSTFKFHGGIKFILLKSFGKIKHSMPTWR